VKKKKVFKRYLILLAIFLLNIFLLLDVTSAQVCSSPEHCGLQFDGDLCVMDINFENSFIVSALGSNTGDIRTLACQNAEYVSDGLDWIGCFSGPYIIELGTHDYLCKADDIIEVVNDINQGFGRESIIECCGSESCNSDSTDGRRLTTGESITLDNAAERITETCGQDQLLVGVDSQGNIICEDKFTSLPITTNTFNYNIFTSAGSPTNAVNLVVTINSGVIVGSTDTSLPALTTGNLPAGSTLTIINNGRIQGAGGRGATAACGDCGYGNQPQRGSKGGDALEVLVDITIDNQNGEIWSGGGGGGDGGYALYTTPGGGGGGAGFNFGLKGRSSNAQDGTLTTGGAGGTAVNCYRIKTENPRGGAGGGPGEPGIRGDASGRCGGGGTGGAAGNSISGLSSVTFIGPQGDIRGPTI